MPESVIGESPTIPGSAIISGIDDPATLRRAFTLYPRGVMAVAAQIDGSPVGLAVSAFVSVSLDPPLILICLDNGSKTWPTLRLSPSIGVSVLAEDQAWLGRQLASRSRDRFADAVFRETAGGGLLLEGSVAQWECTLEQELPGGDHVMALLRVVEMSADASVRPLLWHDSAFTAVAPLASA
jgi:flavin reductase (DIM6/NTAB) family NADH-FMN oxidoreductase RutF